MMNEGRIAIRPYVFYIRVYPAQAYHPHYFTVIVCMPCHASPGSSVTGM